MVYFFVAHSILQHFNLTPEFPLGSPLSPRSSSFSWMTIERPMILNSGSAVSFTCSSKTKTFAPPWTAQILPRSPTCRSSDSGPP